MKWSLDKAWAGALVSIAIAGCATRPEESGTRIDLKAQGPHPVYVALTVYVSEHPLDLSGVVDDVGSLSEGGAVPNACYEITNEQGAVSRGFAQLSYDGRQLTGTLISWGAANYSLDVEIDDKGSVAGTAAFGAGHMRNKYTVAGSASPLRNFDLCRRLAARYRSSER